LSGGVRSRITRGLALAVALTLAACGTRARPPLPYPAPLGEGPSSDLLLVGMDGGVRAVPIEEYVAGCVLAEIGSPRIDASAARRAREVQAILCRSYGAASRGRHAQAGFDVCATTHCQVYRPVPETDAGRLARAAARDTRGVVLLFEGRPVRPPYHAACGGRTSPAHEVWPGEAAPWLTAVDDAECGRVAPWSFSVELGALERALRAGGHDAFGPPLQAVDVASRDASGRAASIRLAGRASERVRGDEFRAVVTRALGAASIPSTLFSIRRAGRQLVFEGRGAGHGVGLCQTGAMRLALRGQTPESILRHFYPGVTLGPLQRPRAGR